MSFTTRCPACGTVFRVVADQLKISDGWVRCGHCSDVFDATIHLQAWEPPARKAPVLRDAAPADRAAPPAVKRPAPTAPAAPAAAPAEGADLVPLDVDPPPADDDLRAWFGDGPLHPKSSPAVDMVTLPPTPTPAELPLAPPPPVAAPGEPAPDFRAELQRFAMASRSGALEDMPPATDRVDLDLPIDDPVPDPEPTKASTRKPVETDAEADDAVPGFVRAARRRAFWSSRWVRSVMALLAVLLAALLAGQWVIQERHQLVAAQPQWRPWIEQACGWVGCDLKPVRRIESVEIESAELVRRLGNFYSFDFVLRNRSSLEVALPALELTLTGIGEQPLARRVFLPRDWPGAPAALPPLGTVSVNMRLSLSLGDEAASAGYRALVFYP